MRLLIAVLAMIIAPAVTIAATLDIYFIDAEGGQATLVVTPTKQTLLIDSGYSTQELVRTKVGTVGSARRIAAAARDAHVTKIDYLLITHFHRDHIGGVPELARLLPIGTLIDYGAPVPNSEKTPESIKADALDLAAFE